MHNSSINLVISAYLVGLFFLLVPSAVALSYMTDEIERSLYSGPSVYDMWNVTDSSIGSETALSILRENDWISDSVTRDEFDYIYTMIEQLQPMIAPDVPIEMVLAVISVESSYIQDMLGFSDDSGLMQVIPRFHRARIGEYLYDENTDIFDVRVNVSTGMDYLQELMEWLGEDEVLVLMAYNEGPSRALAHRGDGVTSAYAETVLERMGVIREAIDRRYGSWLNVDRPQKPLREESSN